MRWISVPKTLKGRGNEALSIQNGISNGLLSKVLNDNVLVYLFEQSHFKPAQLDSLLVKRASLLNHVSFKDLLRYKDKPASAGSASRSARQAEVVISKSMATLLLALHLGLISEDAILAIPRIRTALTSIGGGGEHLDAGSEAISLLNAFLKRSSQP